MKKLRRVIKDQEFLAVWNSDRNWEEMTIALDGMADSEIRHRFRRAVKDGTTDYRDRGVKIDTFRGNERAGVERDLRKIRELLGRVSGSV